MMKKAILSTILGCFGAAAIAQNIITDTVTTGPQYQNQIWYSLESGNKTSTDKFAWDIAFRSFGVSASIIINDGGDVQLWKYPNGGISEWNTVDTAGMNAWTESFNSEKDWEEGAFNQFAVGSLNYGWGEYDQVTHDVTGNAIFIIKLADGNFKKIIIESLLNDGTFNFKYANLDGTQEQSISLLKSNYADKNYVYYSLSTDQILDLEPNRTEWDLLFTQYTDVVTMGPEPMPYKVAGVLTGLQAKSIQADEVDQDSYKDYENHTFESDKNIIGYDWKSFDMNTSTYLIEDSIVYFINSGDHIWKVVFTDFGGSANGEFMFTKELLKTTSIHTPNETLASLTLYPNPVVNADLNIAYHLSASVQDVTISIFDNLGRVQFQEKAGINTGMNVKTVNTQSWAKGMYVLIMDINGQKITKKITVL